MSEQTAPTVANLKLRFADETDVETILGLIRGLADYERLKIIRNDSTNEPGLGKIQSK